MKPQSLEAKVIEIRAKLAALRGDERADAPSGPERTAYNHELRRITKLAQKLEAAFASPDYAPASVRHHSRAPNVRPKAVITKEWQALQERLRPSRSSSVVRAKRQYQGKIPKALSPKKLKKRAQRMRYDAATRKAAEVNALRARPEWQAFNRETVQQNLALQEIHRAERAALLERRGVADD